MCFIKNDVIGSELFNEGMKKFIGNILFTSHDHELTQTVANRIIDIKEDGKVIDREVTYNEYLGVE